DIDSRLYYISIQDHINQDLYSKIDLINKKTRLNSRKFVDRSAVTCEHYITRDKASYKKMFKKAGGGGFYTGFTVVIKFMITAYPWPLFISGFAAAINYSISFLAIQFSGFTLATKQPSMTASTLASKMQFIDT